MSEEKPPYIIASGEAVEPVFNLGMLTFTCKDNGKVKVGIIPGKKTIYLTREQARALAEFLFCTEPDEEDLSAEVEEGEEGEDLQGTPASFLEIREQPSRHRKAIGRMEIDA